MGNKIKNDSLNTIQYNDSIIKHSDIRFTGKGNKIILDSGVHLTNCNFNLFCNDSTVHIGKNSLLNEAEFFMEESGNTITIGNGTKVSGKTQFSAIEGTNIVVGNDCMFSSEIVIQTGDAHSIIKNGERVNPSCNITVGSHVWVGRRAIMLKGSSVSDNSIIGAGALVCNDFSESGVILAGVPAKIIKKDITWDRKRL